MYARAVLSDPAKFSFSHVPNAPCGRAALASESIPPAFMACVRAEFTALSHALCSALMRSAKPPKFLSMSAIHPPHKIGAGTPRGIPRPDYLLYALQRRQR